MAAGVFFFSPATLLPPGAGAAHDGCPRCFWERRDGTQQQTPGGIFTPFGPPGGHLMANNGKAKLSDLTPDDRNANKGTQRGTGTLNVETYRP